MRREVVISVAEVLDALAVNPLTGIFLDRSGSIVEVMPFEKVPDPSVVLKLGKKHKGQVFRVITRGTYTRPDLERWSAEAVEGLELAEHDKLWSGANCI